MMFTFASLYDAYRDCARTKRSTHNAIAFEANLIENLIDLETSLQSRKYSIGRSICFVAHSPKMREIFAADFRDRVVHHLLIRAIEPFYERKFVFDVYNNRKDKGIHSAVKRTQHFAKEFTYVLQLDIKGFFYNIDKNILFKQFFHDISQSDVPDKQAILYLANRIIYHDPTKNVLMKGKPSLIEALPSHKTLFKLPKHQGLPIGNLTSQFFANVYLNPFDHFVKRVLCAKGYVRYVDDFVLFSNTKEELLGWKEQIIDYLRTHLALRLRDDGVLKRVNDGLDFLGYIIRPHYMLVRRRVVNNFKQKKACYLEHYEALQGKMSLEHIKQFLAVQASFRSHVKHANSYHLLNTTGALHDKNPFSFTLSEHPLGSLYQRQCYPERL